MLATLVPPFADYELRNRTLARTISGIRLSYKDFERLGRGPCDRADLQEVVDRQPEHPVDGHEHIARVVVGMLEIRPWKQKDSENVLVAFLAAKGLYETADRPVPDVDALAELIGEADRDRPTVDAMRRRLAALF
jgi:hypothetical protein